MTFTSVTHVGFWRYWKPDHGNLTGWGSKASMQRHLFPDRCRESHRFLQALQSDYASWKEKLPENHSPFPKSRFAVGRMLILLLMTCSTTSLFDVGAFRSMPFVLR